MILMIVKTQIVDGEDKMATQQQIKGLLYLDIGIALFHPNKIKDKEQFMADIIELLDELK